MSINGIQFYLGDLIDYMQRFKSLLCLAMVVSILIGCTKGDTLSSGLSSVEEVEISEEPEIVEEEIKPETQNVLMVGNSFTFRKYTGYGVYSILKEMVSVNSVGSSVDKFVHEGCSIVSVADKYMSDFEEKVNQKEYNAIILQGPLKGRYEGVYCDEMKDASVKIANIVLSSKSKNAKIYYLSTHGYHVENEIADFDDVKTQGLAMGWKDLSDYVNETVVGIETDVIYGGDLEGIFQKQTGIKVICGYSGSEYDRHSSWYGAYCLAAAVYMSVFESKINSVFEYRKSIEGSDQLENIVGVGKGPEITLPDKDNMSKINDLAGGCAEFETDLVVVEKDAIEVKNHLYRFTDGETTYRSSDESVATVDNNGIITLHKSGSTIITATIHETDTYVKTDARFLLKVK